VMIGNAGTGKDHMLVGTAKALITEHDLPVTWVDARKLATVAFAQGAKLVASWAEPQILILSDVNPAPSKFEQGLLHMLADERYRNLKPTWISANVVGMEGMFEAWGEAIASRWLEGATAIKAAWPDYRLRKGDSGGV
jgi:DNA replication protein DnaC